MSSTMERSQWPTRRLAGLFALAIALGVAWPAAANAQAYPTKPIHIVVPFPPGGAVDTVARVVGQKLSEQMGQPVIVENKPGASANIGAEAVARAAPDGYTLLMGANGLATNVTLFPNLTFDARRDFVPVARIGFAPLVLVVNSAFSAKSLRELVDMAKAQPGKLTYGSAGNGSSGHLAGELFKQSAGIDVLHVPYKGGAPAITDLLGERITFMPINPIEVLPHIKSGRLRPLAVGSTQRVPSLPEVPTFIEEGVVGYEASVWWGLVAPAKTPPEIIAKLNAETNKALADPGVRQKLGDLGAVIDPGTPEQFGAFLKSETDRWARVIKTAGIRPD